MKQAAVLEDAMVAVVQISRRINPSGKDIEMTYATQPLMAAMIKFGVMHTCMYRMMCISGIYFLAK